MISGRDDERANRYDQVMRFCGPMKTTQLRVSAAGNAAFYVLAVLVLGHNTGAAAETTVPASDLQDEASRIHEFVTFNPNYLQERTPRIARARSLGKVVREREAAGRPTLACNQILNEVSWLIDSTADFKRIDQRLNDLDDTLAHPEREADAAKQDPRDGSWARYTTEWFLKVDLSFDHLIDKQVPGQDIVAPLMLDRINSPQKLSDYFMSVAVSDITHQGVDHRRELNESLANLSRLIFKDKPGGYHYHPALKQSMRDLILAKLRNPATGCWGEQYVRDGNVQFVDDLSVTFHMVSYMHGEVPDLPKILDFVLAARDLEYPVGWLKDGKFTNHNNMDVVTLFQYGWPQANTQQRRAIAAELQKMLDWCLQKSLQPDGAFKPTTESLEEEQYFGVSFLSRCGYFDKSNRFWTDQTFPESETVRQRLIAEIKSRMARGRSGFGWYEDALQALQPSQ